MICANCARLAELEEENRQLRQDLAYEADKTTANLLKGALGVTPQQALIVSILYRARGRTVSWDMIDGLIPRVDGAERANPHAFVGVQICKARARLGLNFINNDWGKGFRLSDAARATCDAILSQAQQVAA